MIESSVTVIWCAHTLESVLVLFSLISHRWLWTPCQVSKARFDAFFGLDFKHVLAEMYLWIHWFFWEMNLADMVANWLAFRDTRLIWLWYNPSECGKMCVDVCACTGMCGNSFRMHKIGPGHKEALLGWVSIHCCILGTQPCPLSQIHGNYFHLSKRWLKGGTKQNNEKENLTDWTRCKCTVASSPTSAVQLSQL